VHKPKILRQNERNLNQLKTHRKVPGSEHFVFIVLVITKDGFLSEEATQTQVKDTPPRSCAH
jgi:hypothetical protein